MRIAGMVLSALLPIHAATPVLKRSYDNGRTGANLHAPVSRASLPDFRPPRLVSSTVPFVQTALDCCYTLAGLDRETMSMRIGNSIGLVLAWACASIVTAAPLSKIERQRLVAHLELTQSWLQEEVAGLSNPQLRFRPSPSAWSVVEVVEHLRLAEPIYWQQLKDAVKAPPGGQKPPATSDADVLWYGIDRTVRQRTEDRKSPHDESIDLGTGLEAFRKLHGEMLEYARTSDHDLRSHLVPKEDVDAYQWILEISAHTQRHILQIREIKASPSFPRK